MIDDLKIGIYEFLLRCNPHYDDDEVDDQGGPLIFISCNEDDLARLADDMGVGIRESETAWEAIQRYMENEINAEKKEGANKD